MNTRIELNDTIFDAIAKLADKDPAVMEIIATVVRDADQYDLMSGGPGLPGGFMYLLHIDTDHFYGSRFRTLFEKVAGGDSLNTLALIRSIQMGYLSRSEVDAAIQDERPIDTEPLLKRLRERLDGGWERPKAGDLTVASEVVKHMKAASTEEDWERRCSEVKRANGGQYPGFWFARIIMGGVIAEREKAWRAA